MTKRSVQRKPPTPKVPAPLTELLHTVEDRCNRAVAVINTTRRAVVGDELGLYDNEDVRRMLGASLERIAEDLTAISDRALEARTAGGAA